LIGSLLPTAWWDEREWPRDERLRGGRQHRRERAQVGGIDDRDVEIVVDPLSATVAPGTARFD